MKKTLAAVAVLGAFAGSALAADVTLYGKVDLGLHYLGTDTDGVKTNNWDLKSGGDSASRFGLKGSEQISEGLKVGFQLEHSFDADNGKDSSDRAFHREARLYVATDFGTLHMGRFGALDSTTGSLGMIGGLAATTGYGDVIGDYGFAMMAHSRLNNSIAYTSPEFAGIKVSAMVSLGDTEEEFDSEKGTFQADDFDREATSNVDRYYGLGVKGQWGALGAGLIVSQLDKGHKTEDGVAPAGYFQADDAMNYTAGVNYDFGFAKMALVGNYYDQGKTSATEEVSSWGVNYSIAAPLPVGSVEAVVAYGEEKKEVVGGSDEKVKAFNVGAMYHYPLSKRTYLYAGAGFGQEKDDDNKTKTYEVSSGLVHNF